MVKIKIDGIELLVKEGSTILEAASKAKVSIPTLCFWKGLNEIAACRVCLVEIKGTKPLAPACVTKVKEGMEIITNSPRVREARKTNVELILSQHSCKCATCVRSGNCRLQDIANDLNIITETYKREVPQKPWPQDFPLIRDESKCIKCMRCIQVCDKIQVSHVWDLCGTGERTTVCVKDGKSIKESDCTLCGQCITHCPVGALSARDDSHRLLGRNGAFADKDKITVVQIAPAIRSAWGEQLGLSHKEATVNKLVGILKYLGFDYVFDTDFGADLTIMEEGSEFLERFMNKKKYQWPMFTSCCPGWVRYIKAHHPDLIPNLSSAKSPHQMQGAITKTYFAGKIGVDPSRIFNVSIMPCVAKKAESDIPTINDAGAGKDVDMVLTTRELVRMIKADCIDVKSIPEAEFDSPLGTSSGAGVIFGVTGGVMEAALRSAYFLLKGKNPDADAFKNVRGFDGWREETIDLDGAEVKIAVASGLANTEKLIKAIKDKKVNYDFVEIMACPNGCITGGGQPIFDNECHAKERAKNIYDIDKAHTLRYSHENKDVQALYKEFLDKPLSHKSHELLHTDHSSWKMPNEE